MFCGSAVSWPVEAAYAIMPDIKSKAISNAFVILDWIFTVVLLVSDYIKKFASPLTTSLQNVI
jgi:Flp pilus assembly protein protease CpaA